MQLHLQFCADVQPGNARAKECLEDHLNDAGFSSECKAEMEKMMQVRFACPSEECADSFAAAPS